MADGSIRVNTGLNLTGIKKDIKEFEKEIAKAEKEIEAIQNKKKKATSKYEDDAENGYFETQDEAIEKQVQVVEELDKQMAEVEAKAEKYKQMMAEATAELQKQQALSGANNQLNQAISDNKFADSIKSQEEYNSILEETERKMAQIEAEAERIAQNTGVNKNELLQQNGTYQKLADQHKILTNRTFEFEKASEQAGNTVTKSMKKATKSSSAFGASIKKGIKSLKTMVLATFGVRGAYMAMRQAVSNYLQSNEALASQMEVLKGTFAQAIGPAIEYVINLLMKAVSYVNAFINALTGINLVAKANAAALKKQGDAAKSSRQSAGFDEQTKLSDSSGGGGSNATIDAFSSMPDFLAKMKEQILADDWYGAGQTLGKSLMDGIEGVDWEGLGFKIGEWLGNALEFLLGFLTEIDAATLLEKVNEFLAGLFDACAKSIESLDWKEIGKKLLDLILVALAFTNPVTAILALMLAPDGDKMAESASEFVGSLIGALIAALAGMGERIGELWQIIKDYFDDYVDWEGTPEDIIEGIFEGIKDALLKIDEWIYEHMWKPFIKGFKKAFGINSPSKKMKPMGGYLIDGLKEGIGNIWKKVKSKFDDFLSKIQDTKSKIKSKAKDAGSAFATGMKEGLNALKDKLKSPINAVIGMVEKAINWIINKLNKLSWKIPDWVPSIGGQKFGFNMSTVSIPRLAKGGIVNNIGKGVPLIAGEAGKEAILPLENNTEWMDILVDKINSGNTTIPIYLDGKLIAKYIIDLQKRRAFATNGG